MVAKLLSIALLLLAGQEKPATRPGDVAPAASSKRPRDYPHTGEPAVPVVKPLLDVGLRDTAICLGPDHTYYMTGTIGPDFMTANAGIQLWKSKDLKTWKDLGVVWQVERDGTWQKQWTTKNGDKRRAVWAPEIHYVRGNFYIPYCVTGLGTAMLKSASGRAEGPYVAVNVPDAPLTKSGIDASLFEDDDGKVYFVYGSGYVARMKEDMSGLAERPAELRCEVADPDPEHHHPNRPVAPSQYDKVGFEGAFLFRANGRYYLSCAERYCERYHCMTAESETLMGPYHARYVSVPYAGHNTFFKDAEGQWWSTMFGNDEDAPIHLRPGILKVEFDEKGHIRPVMGETAWDPAKARGEGK